MKCEFHTFVRMQIESPLPNFSHQIEGRDFHRPSAHGTCSGLDADLGALAEEPSMVATPVLIFRAECDGCQGLTWVTE